MANLSSLLATRTPIAPEDNIEQGKIYTFSSTATYSTFSGCFCWIAPAAGTVEAEVWGAGGSGSRMCCCNAAIAGNSGAYAKRTVTVEANCYFCGWPGKSCRNGSLCFRGCSEPGNLCWTGNGTSGCICAQGGRAGQSFCTTGTAMWCCFAGNNWCNTRYNGYCGLICNQCPGGFVANAYGGEVNKPGNFSCVTFWHCYPNCNCSTIAHVATPPGFYTEEGGVVSYQLDADNGHSDWSGMALNGFLNSLSAMGKQPSGGTPWTACWNGVRQCQCYETQGCSMYVPHGFGGPQSTACSGVRDNGWAGGDALIRLKFIQS
jgi:hypothetical protein